MTAIIGAALQVAAYILGYFLEKNNASKEIQKEFYEWLKRAAKDTSSSRLLEAADKMLKELDENPWQETK